MALWRSIRARAISDSDERVAWAIVVATIPAVIAGGLGQSFIEDHLGEPWQIAILLIAGGLLLGYADRRPQRERLEQVGTRQGLYIGLAQVLALAPGVSRSGITITAGRFLGLNRDSAARFSFLLLAPVTAGAVAYKGYDAISNGLPHGVAVPMIVGTIAAAVSGYLAIAGLLALVRRHSYDVFVAYRVLLGLTNLGLIGSDTLLRDLLTRAEGDPGLRVPRHESDEHDQSDRARSVASSSPWKTSFQRRITIGSIPWSNRAAIASR